MGFPGASAYRVGAGDAVRAVSLQNRQRVATCECCETCLLETHCGRAHWLFSHAKTVGTSYLGLMSPEQFAQLLQAISNDSIWKIVLGAVLAVAGGFLAKLWDEWRARLIRRNAVYTFGIDVLDSYSATFSELVEYQGQTGTIWLAILERITEEYSAFSRNREHLILINDTTLHRDIQSTILKVHGTANLLKVSVVDEQTKQNAHAPQAELEAAARMTRHRFDQLRHQIDQARDLRQRLASGHPR